MQSFLLQSVSAFAPICNPMNCPWGKKAFTGYLGADQEKWKVWGYLVDYFSYGCRRISGRNGRKIGTFHKRLADARIFQY